MIKNYENFKESLFLDHLINESVLYYSPDFRLILKNLMENGNKIAKDLLNRETIDIEPDMTCVDYDKEGYLSFITMKNVDKYLKNITSGGYKLKLNDNDTVYIDKEKWINRLPIYDKSRNPIKIGRFVKKVCVGNYSEREVENFVNLLKSSVVDLSEKFLLVSGDDINHYYHHSCYYSDSGTLGSSCMKNVNGVFDIYVKNPDVCQLLVLIKSNKLLGRALIWKINTFFDEKTEKYTEIKSPLYFMDRIYTNKDSDVNKFIKYAEDNNYIKKRYNDSRNTTSFILPNSYSVSALVTIKVKVEDYKHFPYLDTFKIYDSDNGILINDDDNSKVEYNGFYLLTDIEGGYDVIQNDMVYSNYLNRVIPRSESVWSTTLGSYLLFQYSIYVSKSKSPLLIDWFPDDYPTLVYSSIDYEYYHKFDTVFSKSYNTFIYEPVSVRCVDDVYSDGDVERFDCDFLLKNDDKMVDINFSSDFYTRLCKKFPNWKEYKMILKELVKEVDGVFIPNELIVDVYEVTDDKYKVKLLSDIDAINLSIPIDKSSSFMVDKLTYIDNVKKIPNYRSKLKNSIDKFSKVKTELNLLPKSEDISSKYINNDFIDEMVDKLKDNLNDFDNFYNF